MPNSRCTDQKVGALLHAYELGTVSADDTERFEIHIMGCRHCFAEIQHFAPRAALIRSHEAIRKQVDAAAGSFVPPASSKTRFWHYLWPDVPLIFRPAAGLLVILLMVYPTCLGLRQLSGNKREVVAVQMIYLSPTRTVQSSAFSLSSGLDGSIGFVIPEAHAGKRYHIGILNEAGTVVARIPNFTDFDVSGRGQLVFQRSWMKQGVYTLTISASDAVKSVIQEYRFTIKE